MTELQSKWPDLNVILCHDWLTGMRGGERVLEILCRMFPRAPIYTLIHNPRAISEAINRHRIITSRLQHIPGIQKRYRHFLPLFPSAIQSMKAADADLLISTSHCVAKGLPPRKGTRHLCYCFTPMRYAWLFYSEYFGKNPVKQIIMKPLLARLRRWDLNACGRVDRFATLSRHVRKRILDYYGREADVVYPPVNTAFWTPAPYPSADMINGRSADTYDLIVSALAPYKRIDLAVKAYARTGRRLVVVGTGTEFQRLSAMAAPNIEFTGWLSDERVRELYRGCRALVFPGEEDFGIVPVEAQACGRPVVAYARGGALETVKEGVTGVFFHEQTQDALIQAVKRCSDRAWDTAAVRAHAEQFSQDQFVRSLAQSIGKCLNV